MVDHVVYGVIAVIFTLGMVTGVLLCLIIRSNC